MMPYNETIQFTFKGRDQLSGPTANAQRRIDALGGGFKKSTVAAVALGTALGAAVGGGLLAFGSALRNGFRDAQTYNSLLRQTGAVLKSTGGAANVNAEHVKKMASHLESLSLVDENLILNSENVLLTFRNIRNEVGKGNDIFDQATKAALDLSIAMHEDLQTASVQVGKALNDPIDGMNNLRRIGVTFSKSQQDVIKNLEKTGHHLEAQKMILAELRKEFGGTAEAAGKGLPGALFRLKDAITDAFRDLFIKYEPGLARFAEWLAKKVPGAVAGLIGVLDKLGGFLSKDVVPKLVKAFHDYGPQVVATFVVARDKAVAVWKEYGPKVAAVLAQARDKAVELWKEYGPRVTALVDRARDKIGEAISKVKALDWNKIIGNSRTVAGKVVAVLKDVGTKVYDTAKVWGGRILDGINTGLKTGDWGPLGKTIGQGLSTGLLNLGSAAGKIGSAVDGWFASVDWLEVGKKAAKIAVPFIIGFVTDFVDDLISYTFAHPMDVLKFIAVLIPIGKFAYAFKPLRAVIEHLPFGKWFLNTIGRASAAVFDGIKEFVKGFGSGVVHELEALFPRFEHAINYLFRGGIGGAMDKAKGFLRSAAEFVMTEMARGIAFGVKAMADAIGLIIRTITWPFRKAGGWLIPRAKELITGLMSTIGKELGYVAGGIREVIDKITSPFKSAGSWLIARGRQLLGGWMAGVQSWINRVRQQIGQFISDKVQAPFRAAGSWLISRGSQLLSGFLTGIRSYWGRVWTWVGSVKGWIQSRYAAAKGWLFNAGYNVLWGFWHGMTVIWQKVTSWVGGIADWIRAHKGPISLDSKLLIPAGVAIMTGFYNGLRSGAGRAWDFVKSVGGKTVDQLREIILGGMNPGGAGHQIGQGLSTGVKQWGPLVMQALQAEGLSPLLLAKVLRQMQTESGGNPNAINLWDSNAKAGHPSKGLMQVIPGTFAAYHWPGTSWNIYDPKANIYAALNYARHRYGPNLNGLGEGHGYDSGGIAPKRGWFWKGTNQPERVLSPQQTKAFEKWMTMRHGPGGRHHGGDVNIYVDAPNYLGSEAELFAKLDRWARGGRMRRVVAIATQ